MFGSIRAVFVLSICLSCPLEGLRDGKVNSVPQFTFFCVFSAAACAPHLDHNCFFEMFDFAVMVVNSWQWSIFSLSLHLFLYLSIYLYYIYTTYCIYLYLSLSMYLSISTSIYIHVHLSTYLYIYIYIYLPVSTYLSIYLPIYLSLSILKQYPRDRVRGWAEQIIYKINFLHFLYTHSQRYERGGADGR